MRPEHYEFLPLRYQVSTNTHTHTVSEESLALMHLKQFFVDFFSYKKSGKRTEQNMVLKPRDV